jgi:hypothetical protein
MRGLPWRDETGSLWHFWHVPGIEPFERNQCMPGLGQGQRKKDISMLC